MRACILVVVYACMEGHLHAGVGIYTRAQTQTHEYLHVHTARVCTIHINIAGGSNRRERSRRPDNNRGGTSTSDRKRGGGGGPGGGEEGAHARGHARENVR